MNLRPVTDHTLTLTTENLVQSNESTITHKSHYDFSLHSTTDRVDSELELIQHLLNIFCSMYSLTNESYDSSKL